MNPLRLYLLIHRIDACAAMNLLQDRGIVSDNAIEAGDVAREDCAAAIEFLKANP